MSATHGRTSCRRPWSRTTFMRGEWGLIYGGCCAKSGTPHGGRYWLDHEEVGWRRRRDGRASHREELATGVVLQHRDGDARVEKWNAWAGFNGKSGEEKPKTEGKPMTCGGARRAGGRGNGDHGGGALRKGRCEGGARGGCSVMENNVP